MKNNYNDIIDIILTLTADTDIKENIVIGGSIVPYIILEKEPNFNLNALYVLIKPGKANLIRRKLKTLSKEYQFDIVSDSKTLSDYDYGFDIEYEGIHVVFFPYYIKNNEILIKTYSLSHDFKKIKLISKLIPDFSENRIIKSVKFNDGEILVVIPEFLLVEKELISYKKSEYDENIMNVLCEISDYDVSNFIRKRLEKAKVKIVTYKVKNKNSIITFILFLVFVVLLLIALVCFKK